jgi:hypothetical protein
MISILVHNETFFARKPSQIKSREEVAVTFIKEIVRPSRKIRRKKESGIWKLGCECIYETVET